MGMKLAGVMALLTFVMAGAFYWYYNDTQERMAILNENNAKLEVAVQTSEAAVEQLQVDFQRASEELNKVNTEFADIRRQNRTLSDKLGRHDLGNLAENKPGLVERIITGASKKAGRCFELLSGAELTDKEKEAKNGKSFNSECPWLFDRYVTTD
jgi:chromosome segregation ATPase